MFGIIDYFKRRSAQKKPFPESWREILRQKVPFYSRLPEKLRLSFEEKLKIFARTKYFVPAGGMEMTEEAKVIISAAAARLIMALPEEHYQRLTEIVVYPGSYQHPGKKDSVILGEAHHFGTVVLSYRDVLQGLTNPGDGHETAGHEFAHVLDVSDGSFDGTPPLEARGDYSPWAKTMTSAFFDLRAKDAQNKKSVLRKYGATNEAEFFAVATETFFEKPKQMKEKHPALYQVLCDYYNVDPCTW